MGRCKRCGKQAGLTLILCKECQARDEADSVRLEEERQVRISEEFKRTRMIILEERKKLIRNRLARGERVFLYHSVYIPVDSEVLGQPLNDVFDIGCLTELGLNGWDIVQVVPKTQGIALENKYTVGPPLKTYAGGMGGNVIGVYVLLKKEVLKASMDEDNDELDSLILSKVNGQL
jgi:hypothetical protein